MFDVIVSVLRVISLCCRGFSCLCVDLRRPSAVAWLWLFDPRVGQQMYGYGLLGLCSSWAVWQIKV